MDRCQQERGGITIEFAIVLIGVVALLAAVLTGVAGIVTTVRCVDAAHTVARMSALGYERAELEAAALRVLGSPAQLEIQREEHWVDVTVRVAVPHNPWNWEVSHSASAFIEPEP